MCFRLEKQYIKEYIIIIIKGFYDKSLPKILSSGFNLNIPVVFRAAFWYREAYQ